MLQEHLKKILIENKHITAENFDRAVKIADKNKISVEETLVNDEFLNEDVLGPIIAKELNIPFANLQNESIQDDYLEYLPESVATAQEALIFEVNEDSFKLATTNPDNFKLIKNLEKVIDKKAEIYYAPPSSIKKFLLFYKNNLPQDFRDFVDKFQKTQNDEIIVLMLNRLVDYAYENQASDIHIEPGSKQVVVRVRIDGLLRKVASYPLEIHPKIVFLVKIKSHLRTDEHGMTQDGRFSHSVKKNEDTNKFDIRVSILPVTHGENVVMRILAERSRRLSLHELGLMEEDLEKIKRMVSQPHGMIIVTGATGAGKTTTLYAILQLVDKNKLNVVTIEDPVEYAMEGIQQIQVNKQKELTFASGLRSIVRQDPDMIMVGEIRDGETASIAVNASLTGHVLFSTLHANDTATVFSRMTELDIEPSLSATSLTMIISQHLSRKVCTYCGEEHEPTEQEIAYVETNPYYSQVVKDNFPEINNANDIKFRKGKGCSMCGGTGYLGRIGIFEILEVNDSIRVMAAKGALAQDIKKQAIKDGMKPLEYWELYHLIKGTTTLSELLSPLS